MRNVIIEQGNTQTAREIADYIASELLRTLRSSLGHTHCLEIRAGASFQLRSHYEQRLSVQCRSNGTRAAIALSTEHKPLSRVALYHLVREATRTPFKIDGLCPFVSSQERCFQYRVFDKAGLSLGVLCVWVDKGTVSETNLFADTGPLPEEQTPQNVQMLLSCSIGELSTQYELSLPHEICAVVASIPKMIRLQLLARTDTRMDPLSMKIVDIGECMQSESQSLDPSLQFTLDLGCLNISLEDFVSLRPGSTIRVPEINSSTGFLRYGGEPVASVEVSFEATELKIRVVDFFRVPVRDAQGCEVEVGNLIGTQHPA